MPLHIPQRNTGPLAAIEGKFPMDEAVLALFPSNAYVLSADTHGDSAWTQTGKVTVEYPDGTHKAYFLKLALGNHGQTLLRGEFTAIETLNSLIPGLVPVPLGWGKYGFSPPETYFFIEEFREMDMSLPEPSKLIPRVLQMHSLTSANGKFGFPVTTSDGIAPHINDWEASWTHFFTRLLQKSIELNKELNIEWPEFNLAAERLLAVVIPRLLDPLREDNGPVVPRLIHGDLWGGNIGTDKETGEIIFFDAGSLYAHNELDIAMWRRYGLQNLGQRYVDEYKRTFPPAEPRAEFDDRSRLYSLKFDLNHSSGHPGDTARDVAFNNMVYLCCKYASGEGLPEYEPTKDPSSGPAYIYAR